MKDTLSPVVGYNETQFASFNITSESLIADLDAFLKLNHFKRTKMLLANI